MMVSRQTTGQLMQGFAQIAPRLWDGGYIPLPLKGKKPATKGWRKIRGYSEDGLHKFCQNFPEANTGVVTGDLVAIDIDVDEHETTCLIAAAANDILGFSVNRRGILTP